MFWILTVGNTSDYYKGRLGIIKKKKKEKIKEELRVDLFDQ